MEEEREHGRRDDGRIEKEKSRGKDLEIVLDVVVETSGLQQHGGDDGGCDGSVHGGLCDDTDTVVHIIIGCRITVGN